MKVINRRCFFAAGAAMAGGVVSLSARSASSTAVGEIAGYDYRRPAIPKGATLLFQGDSITDMKWGRNQKDRNHYLGHSFVYLIASRLHTDMPQAKLNFLNRGNSGNTVADLQKRWEKDALALNPDILTVLVGINDVGRAIRSGGKVDPEAFEKGYHSLLSRSREANSKLKIVLLEPFILPVGKVKTAWSEFYSQVELIRPVVAKLSKVFEAVFIPLQEVFNQAAKQVAPDHWIWDGIHPLPQGHELIARNWIEETAKAWS